MKSKLLTAGNKVQVHVEYPADSFNVAYGDANEHELIIRLEQSARNDGSGKSDYDGMVYVNAYTDPKYLSYGTSAHQSVSVSFETFAEVMKEMIPLLWEREHRKAREREQATKYTIPKCSKVGCELKANWQDMEGALAIPLCKKHFDEKVTANAR